MTFRKTNSKIIFLLLLIFASSLIIPILGCVENSPSLAQNVEEVPESNNMLFVNDNQTFLYYSIAHHFMPNTRIYTFNIKNDILYMNTQISGYSYAHAVNISSITSPITLNQISSNFAQMISCEFYSNYAVFAGMQGFYFLDISDPYSLSVPFEHEYHSVEDFVIDNNHIYYASWTGELHIHSLTSLATFEEKATIDLFIDADLRFKLDIDSNNVIVFTHPSDDPVIIDANNPTNPTVELTYATPMPCRNVLAHNGLFYLAQGNNGLAIIDASNPSSPQIVGSYYGSGPVTDVFEYNNTLYLTINDNGLEIVDGSNISDIKHIQYIPFTNANIVDVQANNDTIFVQDRDNGIFFLSRDSDRDGLSDLFETETSLTDPYNPDTDNDTLTDYAECIIHDTNPLLNDTDSDGYLDADEIANGWDPNDPIDPLWTILDSDQDGISDFDELGLGTDRFSNDTDNDDLSDYAEVYEHGTNPLLADTDGDLITDGDEVTIYTTNPLSPDSDNDLLPDGFEIFVVLTNPLNPDTDGDSFSDFDEIFVYFTDPLDELSNIRIQKFTRIGIPLIVVGILVLETIISLLIVRYRKRYKIRLSEQYAHLNLLFPLQAIGWLKSLEINPSTYFRNIETINQLAGFLLESYSSNGKLPTQSSVDGFLLENNISSDLLLLTITVLSNSLPLDLSAKNLLVEDFVTIDEYTKSILDSLYDQQIFPRIDLNYNNNRKTTKNRKSTIPNHKLYHAIFLATDNSLLHTKVLIALLNICIDNLRTIKFKDFTLEDSSYFNFNTDSINAIKLLWRMDSSKMLENVTFYYIPATLNLGVFTTILLLRKLTFLSVKNLRALSKLIELETRNKISDVSYLFTNEDDSSELFSFWKKKKTNTIDLAELATEQSFDSLSELFNSYNDFIHELILSDIDVLATQEEITLIFNTKSIKKYLSKKKQPFIDETKVSNALEKAYNLEDDLDNT
ncbi:MAG: hypothetical protein KGD59_08140 [Candidatus Heimdallarchaeota archaeon]|nr:hypothetical protein [Candidatus Heimdallarchaeota archaeon]MBY8994506.1 hypothetical protein [Candidatus Heimdallarchaeota archaeon]